MPRDKAASLFASRGVRGWRYPRVIAMFQHVRRATGINCPIGEPRLTRLHDLRRTAACTVSSHDNAAARTSSDCRYGHRPDVEAVRALLGSKESISSSPSTRSCIVSDRSPPIWAALASIGLHVKPWSRDTWETGRRAVQRGRLEVAAHARFEGPMGGGHYGMLCLCRIPNVQGERHGPAGGQSIDERRRRRLTFFLLSS
jgi:hypothetical protein